MSVQNGKITCALLDYALQYQLKVAYTLSRKLDVDFLIIKISFVSLSSSLITQVSNESSRRD